MLFRSDTIKQIKSHYIPQENDRYLEIGCGPAFLGTHFAKDGLRVYGIDMRSEERRVGKECRSRWSPYH